MLRFLLLVIFTDSVFIESTGKTVPESFSDRIEHMSQKIPLKTIDPGASSKASIEDSVELNLYAKQEKIYTREIQGFFQRIRVFTGWPLLLGYFLLPWLSWQGQQLILFDLPARKFHIFGYTFWPQDFFLLGWLLIIAAFTLFFFTNWLGRVWCGYTCPQTVWTSIFMWMEQLAEGSRNQRIKLDKQPWSLNKLLKKSFKHALWVSFALFTGLAFVGYFIPPLEFISNILSLDAHPAAVFWTLFFAAATYINAGWMREQVCKYMCPYARFQSAMFDKDTLIVSYDVERGESRGSRKKKADPKALGLGDCVDCSVCVQVCPTGIDIRDGLQYECITCAHCIDACNEVMDKMNYPRGLISYTTLHEQEGGKTKVLRPRLVGYGIMMLLMIFAFGYTIATRIPLGLDIIRDRNQLFGYSPSGLVTNTYSLKIMNMDQQPRTYRLSIEGNKNLEYVGKQEVSLASGEYLTLPVQLQIAPGQLNKSNNKILFHLEATDNKSIQVEAESRFIGPTPMPKQTDTGHSP